MGKWQISPLKGLITEVSTRKGDTSAQILSVTNADGFVPSLDVFDKQVFSRDTRAYKLVQFNDLAYNPSRINVGSIARCQLPEGGAVSPMYIVVRCRAPLLPQFLLYFLKSPIGKQHIIHRAVGAVRSSLRFSDLERIEIPLPPLDEQDRIVRILGEVEALNRQREHADKRTVELSDSLFQQEFGAFPEGESKWPTLPLGQFGRVVTGNTPPRNDPDLYGNYVEWVKTDDIDPTLGIVRHSSEALSEAGALRGRLVPSGAILITCIAGSLERIGDAAITDREVAINQQINAIIPNKNTDSGFVWSLVRSLRGVIQSRAAGVMTRIINKTELERIPAIAPSWDAQAAYASSLGDVRKLQLLQARCRERISNLSDSLVQHLFIGE